MKNIYLIGMMNCGKSTCAGLLAPRLGLTMLDTDLEIEARTGRTVNRIFAEKGEAWFRDRETALLRELQGKENLVVACGGGLPLREENRRLMRESGAVLYLRRDPEKCYDGGDMSGRPLAQAGREDFLKRFAARDPIYRSAAHIIIGDHDTAEEAVQEIIERLEIV